MANARREVYSGYYRQSRLWRLAETSDYAILTRLVARYYYGAFYCVLTAF
jgi:hypothetical protein